MSALGARLFSAIVVAGLTFAPVAAGQKEASEASPDSGLVVMKAADGPGAPGGTVRPAPAPARGVLAATGQSFVEEVEPNDTSATASPIGGTDAVVRGHVYPNADVDYFSFPATAGDRVYAAVMTSFSASGSIDSILTLLGTDGTTTIEEDHDDGSFGSTSSSIAGAVVPSSGTYFLRVRHASATGQLRPYHLHLKVQSGSSTAEVEPNNTTATATPLPASGWASGAVNPAADVDYYSISLGAGDTVFLSLDMDPERDATTWNGRLGLGVFNSNILVVNDTSVTSPNSEALFMTVKDAGTYYVYVDESAAGGAATFTYRLSVGVRPAAASAGCTTYTSADTGVPIADNGTTTSTVTVPAGARVGSVAVLLNVTHAGMADLDVTLTAPGGNEVGLFTDIGSTAQTAMNLRLDDDAAIPIGIYTVVSGMSVQPELSYRLAWFKGQDAGGTWTLTVRDDTALNTGTLNGWSLVICPEPTPAGCVTGTPTTLFTTDFEAGDAGFTHSGTQDEWARGTPTAAPITTCRSGTSCFKTDLAGGYNASSSQDLISPAIQLSGPATTPIRVSWAQKYQMESASFDHYWVEIRPAGSPTVGRKLFEWRDATMSTGAGAVAVQEAAGWAVLSADVSEYAGQNVELRFHVDSDGTIQFAGAAVDDVTVSSCGPVPVELMGFSAD